MRALVLLAAAMSLFAASANAGSNCPASLRPAMTAMLFFGADVRGGAEISDDDWQSFLATEVTPRFPEGLTTWNTDGRWRAPNGVQTHERSRVLLLILSGRHDERAKLEAVIAAYKAKYHQLSVGLVEHADCARF